MAATIRLVQGDDLPCVSFTIRDANRAADGQELDKKDSDTWRPVDLTGAIVSAVVSDAGANIQKDVVVVRVLDAAAGEVILCFNDCVFVTKAGRYDCEVTVSFPIGQQTVYDMLSFDVRERINVSTSV